MLLNSKTAVVTGAGGGVGRQLVLQLIAKGAKVAAVDINEAALKETQKQANAGDKLSIHVVNLTDRQAVENLVGEVKKAHGTAELIINNAGIIQPFVKINDLSIEQIEKVININFYGSLYMIKAFLPGMLERPEAHIVNISSMGGFLPVPGQVAYGASKAALKLLSEGLYSELKGTNVGVSVVLPGAMATDIAKNSNVDVGSVSADEKTMKNILQPSEAAQLILSTVEKNLFRLYIGKDSKMMNTMYKFMPKKAINMINKALSATAPK